MLCERCQEREARVFMTFCNRDEETGEKTSTQRQLCEDCLEIEHPGSHSKMQAHLERGCLYCGKKGGGSICDRCSAELRRIMHEKGFSFSADPNSQEEKTEHWRLYEEVQEEMKKWVAENLPEARPRLPDSIFTKLAAGQTRFRAEAYIFVTRAASKALSNPLEAGAEPISGRNIALAFRALALAELGKKALPTLNRWGLFSTDDIGTVVLQMITAGLVRARLEDKPENFHAIYDFATEFPTV